jgi:hypothetical protein
MNAENRMSVRRSLIPLALALFAARCGDHPTAVQQPPDPALHFLRWAGGTSPQFTATGALSGQGGNGILRAASSDGLSLASTSASFWAVRGEQRSVQLTYLSSTGDTSSQFLRLTIDDPTYAPGQGDLAPGDSVLITVTVDPYTIKVSLEPTGLVFGNPAQLDISYGGADGDLNGDGVVDATDAYIESQLLGLWYREGTDSAWTRIPATQSLSDKSFTSALPHFSEYAISW